MNCYQQEFNERYLTTEDIGRLYGISPFKLSRNRHRIPGMVKLSATHYIFVREIAAPVLEKMQGDKRRRS